MLTLTDEDKTALILQYGHDLTHALIAICEHYDGLYSDRYCLATCYAINREIHYFGMEVGRISDPTLFIKDGNKEINIAGLLEQINYKHE